MFKYTGIMNVSAHEFFDVLLQQICADINQKTGRSYDTQSIMNGCRYKLKKHVGNKTVESIIEICRPIYDKRVETRYSQGDYTYSLIYEINELEPQKIEVTYLQQDGKEKTGLLTRLYGAHTTGQRFKAFEKYIKNNRKK